MGGKDHPIFKPLDRIRDLLFLEEIEQNPKISQRELSNKFGIALGVTNACIKRMARRGWIILKGIPPRNIAYYLTPKGFAEKANLAIKAISLNVQHYAEMKRQFSKKLLEMQNSGVRQIAFYGLSDLMEVAYVTLQGTQMKLVGIIDEENLGKEVFGYKVVGLSEVKRLKPDAILVTSTDHSILKRKELNSIKVFTI